MSAVLLGTWPVGSEEWHAARARGLGGSEIAPVMGLSPWESRFSLYHRKMGSVGPVEESPEMEWGTRLEPAIVAKFYDEHPEMLDLRHALQSTYCHPDRPWQIGNPDARLWLKDAPSEDPAALLEVKCTRDDIGWGQPGTDEIPIYYRTQALWYLDVFDLKVCHIAVLIAGADYREYVVDASEAQAEQAQLRQAAVEFLDSMERGHRPDIDDHGATYQVLRELHPEIDPTLDVELTRDLALGFVAANVERKAAEKREQLAKSLVADAMGEARRATWDTYTIATRQARGDGTPYVVISRRLPAVTTVHTEPGEAA